MNKYIIGYVLSVDRLIHFDSKEEADNICQEWLEFEAKSLADAYDKYYEKRDKWEKNNT